MNIKKSVAVSNSIHSIHTYQLEDTLEEKNPFSIAILKDQNIWKYKKCSNLCVTKEYTRRPEEVKRHITFLDKKPSIMSILPTNLTWSNKNLRDHFYSSEKYNLMFRWKIEYTKILEVKSSEGELALL